MGMGAWASFHKIMRRLSAWFRDILKPPELELYFCIAMKFDRGIDSNAIKFKNGNIILTANLATLRHYKILR